VGDGVVGEGAGEQRSLLDLTVRELLDAVAAKTSAPGGGAVAALAAALAAGLTGMAARYGVPGVPVPDGPSAESIRAGRLSPEALGSIAEQADSLRERAAALVDADVDAYAAYLAAVRRPRDDPRRRRAVETATEGAAAVPAEIAEVGAAVSELALSLRHRSNPNLHGDVVAAVLLAAASTTAASTLVRENLGHRPRDPRLARAGDLSREAVRRTYSATGERQPGRAT
jgi:formiminotetrahydrofolate cyclodeaminase